MRDQFYKYMPVASGLLLGWFLFNPPVWLQSLGPLAYVINIGLCALLLLGIVALLVVANLPARLEMKPIGESEVHGELHAIGRKLEALGFRSVGPPLRVEIAPAATLLGYVHEKEPVYATVFRTGTTPAKTSHDFVSILHGEKGGLTTNAEPAGAALPAGPGGMRQVFPGATIETLFQRHLAGMAYLRERGVSCRNVSADTFRRDFQAAIGRQRETFLSSPIVNTFVTLWRAGTKQVPFIGSLREQKIAERQIARLLAS